MPKLTLLSIQCPGFQSIRISLPGYGILLPFVFCCPYATAFAQEDIRMKEIISPLTEIFTEAEDLSELTEHLSFYLKRRHSWLGLCTRLRFFCYLSPRRPRYLEFLFKIPADRIYLFSKLSRFRSRPTKMRQLQTCGFECKTTLLASLNHSYDRKAFTHDYFLFLCLQCYVAIIGSGKYTLVSRENILAHR